MKAERTKALITETAAPIFNTKGYARTSISDITEAVGLTKGAIYGNFEGKDELAHAAFTHNAAWLVQGFKGILESEAEPWQKLLRLLDFYKDNYSRLMAQGGCPLLNAGVEADDPSFLLHKAVRQIFENMRKLIAGVIKAGQALGHFNAHAQPLTVANAVIALIEGGILQAGINQNKALLVNCLQEAEVYLKVRLLQ